MSGSDPAELRFEADVEAQVETFLALCRTASLATSDRHGDPHAANVQYVHDRGGGLWWVSSAQCQHSRNLSVDPRAAVTVYAHQDAPEQIHGVQARGVVEPALAPGEAGYGPALERYLAKFPFAVDPPFATALATQSLYRFRPTWLRWIDNRRGFGWKVEKVLA